MAMFTKILPVLIFSTLVNALLDELLPLSLSPESFKQIKRMIMLVPPGRTATLSDVLLRHYGYDTTPTSSPSLKDAKMILSDEFFDLQRPTVVYAHGYVELVTDESVQTVVQAYNDAGGYNVLVVDWSNLAFGNYLSAARNVQSVGEAVGKAVSELVSEGLSLDGLHLVGHSLGSHVVGYAARKMDELGNRVPRVTALDAAFPGFYPPLLGMPVSETDADFVDAIHTNGGLYGTPKPTAKADFWPNGGLGKQPGCPTPTLPLTDEDFCSHFRSWRFYAESVRGGEFLARKCGSYDKLIKGKCSGNELVDMGVRASPDLRGNFYLRTGVSAPFALGVRGAD